MNQGGPYVHFLCACSHFRPGTPSLAPSMPREHWPNGSEICQGVASRAGPAIFLGHRGDVTGWFGINYVHMSDHCCSKAPRQLCINYVHMSDRCCSKASQIASRLDSGLRFSSMPVPTITCKLQRKILPSNGLNNCTIAIRIQTMYFLVTSRARSAMSNSQFTDFRTALVFSVWVSKGGHV
jgi:hypothetical protein